MKARLPQRSSACVCLEYNITLNDVQQRLTKTVTTISALSNAWQPGTFFLAVENKQGRLNIYIETYGYRLHPPLTRTVVAAQ